MGQDPSEDELLHFMKEVDIDGGGQIEFNEFLELIEKLS